MIASRGGLVALRGGVEAHDPSHLREAVAATVRGSGDQVEVQLGHFCNNRCVFCVSGQLTEQGMAPRLGPEPVLEALEAAAGRGVRRLTLLGGEPTLQADFLPILRRATDLGFSEIVIFTNGVRTHKERFMEEAVALGRFTWRFSIQGGDAATHDAVVGRPGAFDRIVRGLAWLQGRGQDLTANLCVNALSYRSLPLYPDLLLRHGVRQLHVDVVRPGSAGVRDDDHYRRILVRMADLAAPAAEMLAGFQGRDPAYDVTLGNVPYCVMPAWAHRIHHGGEPTATVTTDDRGRLGRVWDKYAFQASDAVYGDGCSRCGFRDGCRGVPGKYAELFGTSELTPLAPELREASDRRREALRRLQGAATGPERAPGGALRGRLRGLREAPPYPGWRWSGWRADGGALVVRFAGPERGAFEVVLSAEGAALRPVAPTTAAQARPAMEAVAAALRAPSSAGR